MTQGFMEKTVAFIKSKFPEQDFIPLHAPVFYGNEKKYINEAIDSTFVSSVGKFVDEFEKRICEYTGAAYAVATVNGTAALHMSLLLAGVKKDELVITQPLSFIATCNAISYIGALPLFTDVDERTLGLSVPKLEEFLEEKTILKDKTCFHKESGRRIAACVPMHTFGHPVEIEAMAAVCEKYCVPLVEDAAESIGSRYKGQHTGTFGVVGAFSFNGNKTITCGGGGVIVTNDKQIALLGKHLTTQAKIPHRWNFEHDHIGYNYRMPNLNAALACAQLEELDTFVNAKRELSAEYAGFFAKENVSFVHEPENSYSNYWLNALILKDKEERDNFLGYTNDRGVMTRPTWALMTNLKMFKDCISEDISTAERLESRLVNIPSSVNCGQNKN